ncbi:MAG: MATE family efflux transporter [Chloroflexi bacterium]|nr:MATE family efflux transporter [Chloroflexota bacterium]
MFKDKAYYSSLLKIGLPIIAQNFVSSSLNLIDVAMLGQLGETVVASVGFANQVFFLLMLMVFGINSGVGVFSAQLWGKGDVPNIRKVLGIGLMMGLIASFSFTMLAQFAPETVLRFYSEDPEVIALGASYLRTVSFSYIVTAITFAFYAVNRSTGFVRIPMTVTIIALSLKTALNYLLILGNFGFPALGAEGAALATLIARLVEFFLIIAITYIRRTPAAAKISEMVGFSRAFLGTVLKTSMPVVINETLWALGVTTYNMVYGHIGTDAAAAVNIAATIESLAFVIFMGISDACGILVGNKIGASEEDTAFSYARRSLIISTIGAMFIGVLILTGSGLILSIYNVSDTVLFYARNILRVMGFSLWIRTANMTLIVGILRAGGDTRFGLLLDSGSIWLVGVPLVAFTGLVLHLPIYTVYLMVILEESVKMGVALWRFLSKRWITNLAKAV